MAAVTTNDFENALKTDVPSAVGQPPQCKLSTKTGFQSGYTHFLQP